MFVAVMYQNMEKVKGHECFCQVPSLISFCISVSAGLQTPSLTTDWCCSLQSCSRKEVHVEVSQRGHHTNRNSHVLAKSITKTCQISD